MHVFLDPAIVELLARRHEVVEPHLFLLGIDTRIALDRILKREQQFHAGEAARIAARDGGRERVDHETRADAGKTLVRSFGA
jgi:hypothetical protein